MAKTIIATPHAPTAIGTYSQAVRVGDTIYMSGQIGLDPAGVEPGRCADQRYRRGQLYRYAEGRAGKRQRHAAEIERDHRSL